MNHGPALLILALFGFVSPPLPCEATQATATQLTSPARMTNGPAFPEMNALRKINGYAEVLIDGHYESGRSYRMQARVWLKGWRKYRIESNLSGAKPASRELWVYEVRDGRFVCSALVDPKRPGRARWAAFPESWMPNDLWTYLQPSCRVENGKLMGRETVCGLPAEHWRGSRLGKTGPATTDIWLSTDPRFPLILRMEHRTATSAATWRIAKLDLTTPVPDYVFTPQVRPKPGLFNWLMLKCRPPVTTVLWYAVIVAAYAGVVFSLARRTNTRWLAGRVFTGLASVAMLCLLFAYSPSLHVYYFTWSGVPVTAAISLMHFGVVLFAIRTLGLPGGVSIFKGTTWTAVLLIPAAMLLGAATQYPYQHVIMGMVGAKLEVVVPAIIGVVLVAAALTAVEELIFRGYLFHVLQVRFKSIGLAILLQALMFGVFHVPSRIAGAGTSSHLLHDLTWVTIYGILFGILRWRYRNLGVPWLVHLGFNVGYCYIVCSALAGSIRAVEHLQL